MLSLPLIDVAVGVCEDGRGKAEDAIDAVGALGVVGNPHGGPPTRRQVLRVLCSLVPNYPGMRGLFVC